MREFCFDMRFMKFWAIITIFFFSFALKAQSDSCVIFDIETKPGNKGEEICVQIKVKNFTNILTMQFSLAYDPTVIQAIRTQNHYSGPELVNWGPNNINIDPARKVVRVTWDDTNGKGSTVNGEFVLFEICFKLIGPPGSCSRLYLSDKPVVIEFTNGDGDIVCVKDLNDQDQIKIQVPTDLCILNSICGSSSGNGNITVKAWGGKEPYLVDLINPAQSGVITNSGGAYSFNNLPGGTYTIRLRDGAGKDTVYMIDLPFTSPIAITQNSATSPPSCWNSKDGRINVNVTGGSGSLVLGWKPLNIYGVTSISGLGIGKYTLCDTDSLGCVAMSDFDFFQSEITSTVDVIKDATCAGSDGVAVIKSTGGNPSPVSGYQFSWGTNPRFNCLTARDSMCRHDSLPVGTHFVLVRDSRGCQDTVFFEILSSGDLRDSVIIDSVKCFGEANGRIQIYAKSKATLNLPISFSLFTMPQNTPIAGGITNGDLFTSPGLAAGTYRVAMSDNAGCTFYDTIQVHQPFILELIENSIDTIESCNPGRDASLDIRGSGGNGPYKYLWNYQNSTSSVLSGLSAGSYSVTITDAKGCKISKTYNVVKSTAPSITGFNKKEISCGSANDGCAEVLFSLGSSALRSIQWSNSGNTAQICSLSSGTYVVTITDVNGCIAIDSVSFSTTSGSMVLDSFTIKNPSCPGAKDGLILVFIKGGIAPYSFEWNGVGGGQPVLTNLGADTFNLVVKDQSACPPITKQFILIDPPKITHNLTIVKGPSCNSTMNCDGSAILQISGIHPDYSILWSSREQEFSNRDTAVFLCGGKQWAIITNGTCSDSVLFELPFPTPISSTGLITNPSCYLAQDGRIALSSSGGQLNHTYRWENGTSNSTLTGLADGQYHVTITDANNCTHIDSFRLRQPDSVRVDIIFGSTLDVSCYGKNDGKIVTAWGGGNRGPAQFIWIPNVSNDSLASNLAKGTYTLIVTDVNGCTGSISHTVEEPPTLERTFSQIDTPKCSGDQINFSVLTASGGAGPQFRYTINNGAPNAVGDFTPLFSGTYDVRVYDNVGCFVDTTIFIPAPLNDLSLDFPTDEETIQLGDSIRLEGILNSKSLLDTIIWTPIRNVRSPNQTISFVNPPTTTLYVLTVTDENGCSASDRIKIIVENDRKFYVPNVMTVNDDGINDALELFTSNAVERVEYVRVFDRWGALVYETANPDISAGRTNTWKGDINGKFVNPGVYVYAIQVKFIDGVSLIYRGDITVLR